MAVIDAIVTILTRLHDPVAAVTTQLATRATLAVCACVYAVVAVFPERYDSIAALGCAIARSRIEAAESQLVRRPGGLTLSLEYNGRMSYCVGRCFFKESVVSRISRSPLKKIRMSPRISL